MTPTITVAIPLHCSARWVDNVVANVRALPAMVTEILISDQTCLDSAADEIRVLLADDPRVSVRSEAAGLGFADHYQLLLEAGRGELFMWMPHDDIFAPDWMPILAAALAAHPRAWLAFGELCVVEVDGLTPIGWPAFPFRPGLIDGWAAVRMMLGGWSWIPFRGLFRRRHVLVEGLRLTPESAVVAIDNEWTFAVALRSGLVYDDGAVTWKRGYAGSTHTLPLWRSQRRGDEAQAALVLLQRHGPRGISGTALRTGVRTVGVAKRARLRIGRVTPEWLKPPIRKARARLARQRPANPWGASRTSAPRRPRPTPP